MTRAGPLTVIDSFALAVSAWDSRVGRGHREGGGAGSGRRTGDRTPPLRLKPAGSFPVVTAQVIGAEPPVEASVAPGYATLTCPVGRELVVTTSAASTEINIFGFAVSRGGSGRVGRRHRHRGGPRRGRRPAKNAAGAESQAGGERAGGDGPADGRSPTNRGQRHTGVGVADLASRQRSGGDGQGLARHADRQVGGRGPARSV